MRLLKRIFAIATIAASGAALGQITPPDVLQDDLRLGKTISMRKSTASLSEVTHEFTRLLDLPIEVANDMRDRKATVIFKDRPAVDAMRTIAKTLFMEWRKDGRGYRLYLTDASRKLELEQRKHEEAANRKLIMEWAARAAKYEHLSHADISQHLMDALRKLSSGIPESERPEFEQVSEDLAQPTLVSVASALVQSRGSLADRLLKGETIYFSTVAFEGWEKLKAVHLTSRFQGVERIPGVSGYGRLRFDGDTSNLILELITYFERDGGIRGSAYPFMLHLRSKPHPGPLDKELASWGSDGDQIILARSLNTDGVHFPRPSYRSALVGVAEHLEYLADTADICIVADAFRQAASGPHPMKVGTVREYLSALKHDPKIDPVLVRGLSGWKLSKPGAIRTEDGWLMIRHDQYWRLQDTEIPERVLEKLEKAVRANTATLNDYAALASQITGRQRDSFKMDSLALFGFSKLLFRQCWEPLRFWATLSDAQRQRARNGGLDANQLNNNQLLQVRQVIFEGLWRSGLSERELTACLNNQYDLGKLQITLAVGEHDSFQDPEMFPFLSEVTQTNLYTGPRATFKFQIDPETSVTSSGWMDRAASP